MVAFAAQLPGTIREVTIDPADTFMIQSGSRPQQRHELRQGTRRGSDAHQTYRGLPLVVTGRGRASNCVAAAPAASVVAQLRADGLGGQPHVGAREGGRDGTCDLFAGCCALEHEAGTGVDDRRGDHGLVEQRVHGQHHERLAVGEGAEGRRVSAVAHHE